MKRDRIRYAVGLLLIGHLLQAVAYGLISTFENTSGPIPTSFLILIGFGVLQLLYVVPGLIIFLATGRMRAAVALFVGAALTALANVAFWMIFIAGSNLVP